MRIRNLIQRMVVVSTFAATVIVFFIYHGNLDAAGQKESQAEKPQKIIHIKMSEYAYQPDSLVIPAGELVQLDFENVGKIVHEFMAGRHVMDDLDGFQQDLFEGVNVKMTRNGKPATKADMMMGHDMEHGDKDDSGNNGMEGHMEHEHGMHHHGTMLSLKPGDKGTMTFTIPASKKGEWQIGCFEEEGSHYKAGMKGALWVK